MPPAAIKKPRVKKVAFVEPVVEPVATPEPEPETTPEPEPEPVPVAPTCDEFALQFAELALSMPVSVRKQVAARLIKKKHDPAAAEMDEPTAELIRAALRHGHMVYARKRDRAAVASAAKRVVVKAAKACVATPEAPEKEEVVEA